MLLSSVDWALRAAPGRGALRPAFTDCDDMDIVAHLVANVIAAIPPS
jgi:hypothetical protein